MWGGGAGEDKLRARKSSLIKALAGKFTSATRKKDGEAPDSGLSDSSRVLSNGHHSAEGPPVGGPPEVAVSSAPQPNEAASVGEPQPIPHAPAPLRPHQSAASGTSSNGSLGGSLQWVPSDGPALPAPARPSHEAAGPVVDLGSGCRASSMGSPLDSGTHDTGTPSATVSPAMSLGSGAGGLAEAQPSSSGLGAGGRDAACEATCEAEDTRLFSWMPVSAFHCPHVSAFLTPALKLLP